MSLSLLMSERKQKGARSFHLAAQPVRPQSGFEKPGLFSAIPLANRLNPGSIGLRCGNPRILAVLTSALSLREPQSPVSRKRHRAFCVLPLAEQRYTGMGW